MKFSAVSKDKASLLEFLLWTVALFLSGDAFIQQKFEMKHVIAAPSPSSEWRLPSGKFKWGR